MRGGELAKVGANQTSPQDQNRGPTNVWRPAIRIIFEAHLVDHKQLASLLEQVAA
jgi:hypothetical protein